MPAHAPSPRTSTFRGAAVEVEGRRPGQDDVEVVRVALRLLERLATAVRAAEKERRLRPLVVVRGDHRLRHLGDAMDRHVGARSLRHLFFLGKFINKAKSLDLPPEGRGLLAKIRPLNNGGPQGNE